MFFQQALINMGIFDRKSITKTIKTTEGFYFGKSESEGESSYKKSSNTLFDDYLDILPKIGDGCFIITGRKGSGKSAIAKYIKDNATFEDSMFCEIVKSDAINLEKQIQQSSVESETKLVSFFQWLILVKLVKLILEAKNGDYTPELKAIHNFVRNNRGVVEVDKFSVVEVTTMSKQELNVGSLSRIPIFKAIIERMLGKRLEKAPYYKLLPALKEIVYKVLSFDVFKDYQFVVIFDDLDIGFKSDVDQDKQSLMELIRTAKEFNNNQRFMFMLSIANNSPNGFLEFEAVKNIEIGPDRESKQPLPDSAKWMNGSVKNIIINSEKGETLENVEYISDPSYHDVLILRQVQAQYRFEFGEMNGRCIIEYGFPHYFRKNVKGDSFESRLANIYFGKASKSQNVKNATRLILEEFEKLYQMQYHSCLKK